MSPSKWRTKRNEALDFHPLQFFRPGRICALLDIDKATLWRWTKRSRLAMNGTAGAGALFS